MRTNIEHAPCKNSILNGFKLLAFIVVLFYSCKSNKEQEPIDFQGNWVSVDYLKSLENNHSPKLTIINNPIYVTELVIDKQNGDSIIVYNGQKERAAIPFKKSGDSLLVKLNLDPQTAIQYDPKDSTLFFVERHLNRIYRFKRAPIQYIDASYELPIAFPAMVNNSTFAGSWRVTESDGSKKEVEFTPKGQIKGWDKFAEYSVVVNGDMAVNKDGDAIILTGPDKNELAGFYAQKDTIRIYHLEKAASNQFQNKTIMAKLERIK